MPDTCIICGAPVPEGRQVCLICEEVILHGDGAFGCDDYHPRPV